MKKSAHNHARVKKPKNYKETFLVKKEGKRLKKGGRKLVLLYMLIALYSSPSLGERSIDKYYKSRKAWLKAQEKEIFKQIGNIKSCFVNAKSMEDTRECAVKYDEDNLLDETDYKVFLEPRLNTFCKYRKLESEKTKSVKRCDQLKNKGWDEFLNTFYAKYKDPKAYDSNFKKGGNCNYLKGRVFVKNWINEKSDKYLVAIDCGKRVMVSGASPVYEYGFSTYFNKSNPNKFKLKIFGYNYRSYPDLKSKIYGKNLVYDWYLENEQVLTFEINKIHKCFIDAKNLDEKGACAIKYDYRNGVFDETRQKGLHFKKVFSQTYNSFTCPSEKSVLVDGCPSWKYFFKYFFGLYDKPRKNMKDCQLMSSESYNHNARVRLIRGFKLDISCYQLRGKNTQYDGYVMRLSPFGLREAKIYGTHY